MSFFSKVFRGIKKFIGNIFKDLVLTIVTIVAAVATFTAFPFLGGPAIAGFFGTSSIVGSAIAGTGLAAAAIGFDQDWLITLINIVGTFVNIYNLLFGWSAVVSTTGGVFSSSNFLVNSLGLSQETLEFLYNLSFSTRALLAGASLVLSAGINEALVQDISVLEGIGEVIGDVITGVAAGVGNVATSVLGGIFSQPAVLVGLAIGAWFLLSPNGKTVFRSSEDDVYV